MFVKNPSAVMKKVLVCLTIYFQAALSIAGLITAVLERAPISGRSGAIDNCTQTGAY